MGYDAGRESLQDGVKSFFVECVANAAGNAEPVGNVKACMGERRIAVIIDARGDSAVEIQRRVNWIAHAAKTRNDARREQFQRIIESRREKNAIRAQPFFMEIKRPQHPVEPVVEMGSVDLQLLRKLFLIVIDRLFEIGQRRMIGVVAEKRILIAIGGDRLECQGARAPCGDAGDTPQVKIAEIRSRAVAFKRVIGNVAVIVKCPSSNNLRPLSAFSNGVSGSSVVSV